MPCFRPLKAYRKDGGGVAFDSKRGFADRRLELPCGQCVGCRVRRSREWAMRCTHEAQMHARNCFVTLTYCPQKLPSDGSLRVEDFQKFCKRLRKRVGRFRYFHCGEYGDENLRPHYHALLFGVDFSFDRSLLKAGKYKLYTSPTLDSAWKLGFATIGECTYESAAYVSRYVMKKVTGDGAKAHYGNRKPEYITMSRRPGIGSEWLKKFGSEVYPLDEVVIEGRRFRPPRYYDEQVEEGALAALKRKRKGAVARFAKDLEYDRLRVREKVANAKISHLDRSL